MSQTKRKQPPQNYVCFGCKKSGKHWIMECPEHKSNNSSSSIQQFKSEKNTKTKNNMNGEKRKQQNVNTYHHCIVAVLLILISALLTHLMNGSTKYNALKNNIYTFANDHLFLFFNNSHTQHCNGLILRVPKLMIVEESYSISFWFNHHISNNNYNDTINLFSFNIDNISLYSLNFIKYEEYLFFQIIDHNINTMKLFNSSKYFNNSSNQWFHCMVTFNHGDVCIFVDNHIVKLYQDPNIIGDIMSAQYMIHYYVANTLNNSISFGHHGYEGYISHVTIWWREVKKNEIEDDFLYSYPMKHSLYELNRCRLQYFPLLINQQTTEFDVVEEKIYKELRFISTNQTNMNWMRFKLPTGYKCFYSVLLVILLIGALILATVQCLSKNQPYYFTHDMQQIYLVYLITILIYMLICYHHQYEPRIQCIINMLDVPLCFALFGMSHPINTVNYRRNVKQYTFILYFSFTFMYSFKLLLYDLIGLTTIILYVLVLLSCYIKAKGNSNEIKSMNFIKCK